ncbi:Rossmann-like and DUF2520 domain-containing protein [Acinetobacter equi]|uniref:F420-dependent NADP oxidoreductase n=1 Tax=Acinetobacter equi TaxID=1324350 RepID=A0A0N9W178_9GAMM|nr:Rossmann-like and DUF2520 domain-containing protein [Acinetobacter equi]ALH96408.1 F420-dependent NADP oxidoreductase [Acinetobacter equi]
MKIGFIGAGRVATHLAQQLQRHYEVVQIYSRDLLHAQKLAFIVNAEAINEFEKINQHLDLLIIAVSDQAIPSVIAQLKQLNFKGLIVHTSGSTHLNVLASSLDRVGIFYPLQTFSYESEINWQQTPLFIEAREKEDTELLNNIAQLLTEKVYQYSSEQRLSLHLAAVFACNFSNYCYDISKQILDQKQVDFSLLYPLILETAKKATMVSPDHAQTGPARRGDQNILHMHQNMLKAENQDNFLDVYSLLSQQILEKYQSNK